MPCAPSCEEGSLNGVGAGKISGIFGTGLDGPTVSDPAVNPIESLPYPYSQVWSVRVGVPANDSSTGSVVLGPGISTGEETNLKLRSVGKASNGTTYWSAYATICWTFGKIPPACFPSNFDTGTDAMIVQSQFLPLSLAAHGGGYLPFANNMTVEAAAAKRADPFWSFDTGPESDFNLVLAHRAAPTYVNTGIEIFQTEVVTYNAMTGSLVVTSAT